MLVGAGSTWYGGAKAEGLRLHTAFRGEESGGHKLLYQMFWSRDEPVSGLVPLGGFLMRAGGKESLIWEL